MKEVKKESDTSLRVSKVLEEAANHLKRSTGFTWVSSDSRTLTAKIEVKKASSNSFLQQLFGTGRQDLKEQYERALKSSKKAYFWSSPIAELTISDPYLIKRMAEASDSQAITTKKNNKSAEEVRQLICDKGLPGWYEDYLLDSIYGMKFNQDNQRVIIHLDKFLYRMSQFEQFFHFYESVYEIAKNMDNFGDSNLILHIFNEIELSLTSLESNCYHLIAGLQKVKEKNCEDYESIRSVFGDIRTYFGQLEDDIEFFASDYHDHSKYLLKYLLEKKNVETASNELKNIAGTMQCNKTVLTISGNRFVIPTDVASVRCESVLKL